MPNEQVPEIINVLTNPPYNNLISFVVGLLAGGLFVRFSWSKNIKVDKSKKMSTNTYNIQGETIIMADAGAEKPIITEADTTI